MDTTAATSAVDLLAAGRSDPALASTVPVTPRPGQWVPPTPQALGATFPNLEVEELLGQGGMGAVYRARQTHLDRQVALKVLPPDMGRDPAFAERFRREARALARLNHPHIVGLYDFGQAGEWLYLVMELVDGASLRQALRTGIFTPGEALRLVPQLCDALEYAHDQGVVHRDLKPENILLDAQGRLKIADFGLAKLRGEGVGAGSALTQTGQVMGTPAYMAPEQVAGARGVDHRADLYALGVVFYEMLTGSLPLGRFAPPSQQVQVDVRVDEVVLRALEREPEKRWQRAVDVNQAVAGLAAPAGPPVAPAATSRRWSGREWLLVGVGVLCGLLVLRGLGERELPGLVGLVVGMAGLIAIATLFGAGDQHSEAGSRLRRLARSRSDRKVFGICGGLGEHTAAPAWVWRLVFLIGILAAGLGLVCYGLLWLVLPKVGEGAVPAPTQPTAKAAG